MKINFVGMFKKLVAIMIFAALVLPLSNASFAVQESTWNKGQKVNYIPVKGASTYKASDWTKNLVDLYQIKWYENPQRKILKGEFMLVQLRLIQTSLERRGLRQLSASKETLNFKDNNTLIASAQEEAKILKSLGIVLGTQNGYMSLSNPIKRFEAANVLSSINKKILKIPSIKQPQSFSDTKGLASQKAISVTYQIGLINSTSITKFDPNGSLTLEQTMQVLENEVGYYGILRSDVAQAMRETFKVTLNTDLSNSIITKSSYVKYEEKMKTYGFDQLYDNKSSESSEAVTKAEALKMAIAVILNTKDISNYMDSTNEYENAIWVEYSKLFKITDEDINITNYKDKAKYIDVISYFEKCKNQFLKKQPIKDTDVYLKDLDKYSAQEQAAVKDMVANGIIYLLSDMLNGNKYIFKGQLNELVVNFIEKYNTIVMEGDKINTDPEKMPSSANLYPYILSNVANDVYEKPLSSNDDRVKLSPKELYVYKKDYYAQIKMRCEEYFNELLNIDYKTITEENLRAKIETYFIFDATDSAVEKYVKHVKANEIVLKGSSQVQFPVVYFDGSAIRVRLRLQFEVKNSKTKDSLIYLDMLDGLKETYSKKNYDILVDCSMSSAMGNNNLYINEVRLYNGILDKATCGITKEAEK